MIPIVRREPLWKLQVMVLMCTRRLLSYTVKLALCSLMLFVVLSFLISNFDRNVCYACPALVNKVVLELLEDNGK